MTGLGLKLRVNMKTGRLVAVAVSICSAYGNTLLSVIQAPKDQAAIQARISIVGARLKTPAKKEVTAKRKNTNNRRNKNVPSADSKDNPVNPSKDFVKFRKLPTTTGRIAKRLSQWNRLVVPPILGSLDFWARYSKSSIGFCLTLNVVARRRRIHRAKRTEKLIRRCHPRRVRLPILLCQCLHCVNISMGTGPRLTSYFSVMILL